MLFKQFKAIFIGESQEGQALTPGKTYTVLTTVGASGYIVSNDVPVVTASEEERSTEWVQQVDFQQV